MTPDHFTTSDGLRLAYDDQGTGVALLCLPGLTRNMADFEPVLTRFGDRCRVIRMDYRGRGQSDFDPDFMNYNVTREALDVIELLDHLKIGRAIFLGTSRGGLIAMTVAAFARDRLLGIIFNDIGPKIEPSGLTRIMDYVGKTPPFADLDAAAIATASAMAAEFSGVPLSVWRKQVENWFIERPGGGLDLRYDPALRSALLAQADAGPAPDLWPLFDALADLPAAAIKGANSDLFSAETLTEMARRHPGLIVAVVPDRGHVPFLDEPEALAAIGQMIEICNRTATDRADVQST